MTLTTRVVSEVATYQGLVPLAWLSLRRASGNETNRDFWWVALAFGVSWLADMTALFMNPWFVAVIYPVAQVAIIASVFLSRRDAAVLVGLVTTAGVAATFRTSPFTGPDVFLRTVAFLGVCAAVWNGWQKDELRRVVLINFGLGWLAWIGIALYPVLPRWPTWLAYQGCRAVAIGWFVYASTRAVQRLGVVRGGLMRSAA